MIGSLVFIHFCTVYNDKNDNFRKDRHDCTYLLIYSKFSVYVVEKEYIYQWNIDLHKPKQSDYQ